MKHYPNLFVLEEKEIDLLLLAADHKMFDKAQKSIFQPRPEGLCAN